MLTKSQHHHAASHSMPTHQGHNLGSSGTSIINMVAGSNTPNSYSCPLVIPDDSPSPNGQYVILVNAINYQGWSVQLSCDKTDANGKPISFGNTPVKITQSPQQIGDMVDLEPGFDANVTITMIPNGLPQQAGASVTVSCAYEVSTGGHAAAGHANPRRYVVLGSCTWANPVLG